MAMTIAEKKALADAQAEARTAREELSTLANYCADWITEQGYDSIDAAEEAGICSDFREFFQFLCAQYLNKHADMWRVDTYDAQCSLDTLIEDLDDLRADITGHISTIEELKERLQSYDEGVTIDLSEIVIETEDIYNHWNDYLSSKPNYVPTYLED